MRIKFIDCTAAGKNESHISIEEASRLIKSRTGRTVNFSNANGASINFSFFALVLAPPPLDFYLIADKEIPANSRLFDYGGEKIETGRNDNAYLLSGPTSTGGMMYYQAKTQGGMGSLLTHLPTSDDLEKLFTMPEESRRRVQTANATYYIEGEHFFFKSTETIPVGTIIGYSYGIAYWLASHAPNQSLFLRNTHSVLDTNTLTFSPILHLYDAATGHGLDTVTEPKKKVLIAYPLGIITEHLLLLKEASNFQFFLPSLASLIVSAFHGGSFTINNSKKYDCEDVNCTEVELRKTESHYRELEGRGQKLLIWHFPVHTKKQGATPPVGYSLDDEGRTIIGFSNAA
jgi:hypothetical protein